MGDASIHRSGTRKGPVSGGEGAKGCAEWRNQRSRSLPAKARCSCDLAGLLALPAPTAFSTLPGQWRFRRCAGPCGPGSQLRGSFRMVPPERDARNSLFIPPCAAGHQIVMRQRTGHKQRTPRISQTQPTLPDLGPQYPTAPPSGSRGSATPQRSLVAGSTRMPCTRPCVPPKDTR